MKVEIQGLKELQGLFKKLDKRTQKDVLVELTNITYDEAKKRIAKHHKTGKMEHNLYKKVKLSDMQAEIGVDNDGMIVEWRGKKVNYAVFVHFGTKAHEIKPRKRKVLRFVGKNNRFYQFWGPKTKQEKAKILSWKEKKGIQDIFVFRWPRHPGYEGDPFLYDALDVAGKEVTKIFERFVDGL